MHGIEPTTLLLITATSIIAAGFAYWFLSRGLGEPRKATLATMLKDESETAFLFDDTALIDASPSARKQLPEKTGGETDWQRFIAAFTPRFSTLADDLQALGESGSLTILPDDPNDATRINAEWWDGYARLTISESGPAPTKPLIDPINLSALETELETLRNTAKLAPYLVWQETRDGQINWANAAYLDLATTLQPESSNSWPPPRLFSHLAEASTSPAPELKRVSASAGKPDEEIWFDLACKKINGSTLCFATPADAIVHAETSLKGFVQTLTKTFAHLSIGLAVFDKNRQLALFNPALTDLTRLPIDFLSARPTLFALLDRLRENQMMPEPKDYKSWRHQMLALEEAAADGTYEEIWTLPGGQTYRVNGRPHPDGAVALLFEDISAEISLTRNFREELEVGQAVLDALDDAVVVFSSTGMITISNAAYASLWGVDPGTSFAEMSITDATRTWQDICDPTPLWGHLRDFVGDPDDRRIWFGDATLDDGRRLECQISPLTGGATMVKFHALPAPKKPAKKRSAPRKAPAKA